MKRIAVISALILSALTAAPASAAPKWASQAEWRKAPQTYSVQQFAQAKISAREAKAIALRRVPGGEVVDIRRNGDTYRVRVIARDGRVRDIVIDARTGRVR